MEKRVDELLIRTREWLLENARTGNLICQLRCDKLEYLIQWGCLPADEAQRLTANRLGTS